MTKGRIHGWDISLNHSAFVQLDDGKLTGFWYLTDLVGSADRSKEHGIRLSLPKTKDRQSFSVNRLSILDSMIKLILKKQQPEFVGIEDYAIREEQGAHYLGEIGGIARLNVINYGAKLRLHDPISVKMFATNDGTAQKDLVRECVRKKWGVDFEKYDQPLAKPNKRVKIPRPNHQTSEDLSDAYTLAMLVWVETMLRDGKMTLDELEDEKERRVFLRVTKTYPVNLLDRDWIAKEE